MVDGDTRGSRHAALRGLRTVLPCVIAVTIVACEAPDPPADPQGPGPAQTGVTLTPQQMQSLGITTTPARTIRYRRTVAGYGVVMGLDTIAQADADIAAAAAAAAQSTAAAARARSLGTGEEAAVSRSVVEAAESKEAADQAALALARHKFQSIFGVHAPWQTAAQRRHLMAQLSAGQSVLIRVTFPLGSLEGVRPHALSVARLGAMDARWTSHIVWEAPASPALPGRAFYCLLQGSDLVQNEHLSAWVAVGSASTGIWVPASALLVAEGDTWVYVEPQSGRFLRVHADTSRPVDGGLFLGSAAGIAPGERLVTGAAGLLLAHEMNPGAQGGD